MSVNVLFPFMAMVEDLVILVIQYTGGLAGNICTAQFCSVLLWECSLITMDAIVLGVLGSSLGKFIFFFILLVLLVEW